MPDDVKLFLSDPPPRSTARWLVAALIAVAAVVAVSVYLLQDTPAEPRALAQAQAIPTITVADKPAPHIPPAPVVPEITPEITPAIAPTIDPAHEPRKAIAALDDHLLLYLPFASSLDDQSSHHLALEASGTIAVHDGAAYFPGDASLTLPHIALNARPFALAVWIKPEGSVNGYGILEQVDGGAGKHLHILLRDPDKPYIGFMMNDLRAPQSVMAVTGWTHLLFQYTGEKQQIWVNGNLATERKSDPYFGTNGLTAIGKAPRWNNVPTSYFKGAMRDLRLYDVALDAQRIRILAGLEAGAPPAPGKVDDTF